MRRAVTAALVLAFATSALAQSDTPPRQPPQAPILLNAQVPQTVFAGDPSGTVRHVLSQMECPLTSGDYLRTGYRQHDLFGFAVSCTYENRPALSAIIVSLTGGSATPLAERVATARKTYLEGSQKPVLRDAPPAAPSRLGWISEGYSLQEGTFQRDIHTAMLSGRTLTISVLYRPGNQTAVADAVATLAALAEKTAGPRLAACAALPRLARAPSTRTGAFLSEEKAGGNEALEKMRADGAALVQRLLLPDASTQVWCGSGGIARDGNNFIVWRSTSAKPGETIERITPIRDGASGYLVSSGEGAPAFIAMEAPDALAISGPFDNLPPVGTLMRYGMQEAMAPAAYAQIDKKSGKITPRKSN